MAEESIMQYRYINFFSVVSTVQYKQFFNPWRDSVGPYRWLMVEESIMHYRSKNISRLALYRVENLPMHYAQYIHFKIKIYLCNAALLPAYID